MRTLLLTLIIVLLYALSGTATTTLSTDTQHYPEGSDMYECQEHNNCGEDFMNEVQYE